ncbi:Dynein heavy chain 7, axonemal, partial [Cladochytrium tenue]
MELEEIAKQVEELADVGDLDKMLFYVKKVQTFAEQPQTAAETILTALEPYQALYTTAVNFQKSYKRWTDGNLMELDAEQIESEVDGPRRRTRLKRETYRVLGTLASAAAPQNIAKQVKEKIDEFMLNIPVMRVLCNPGIRSRHRAVRMSSLAGFELRPDGNSSLHKMLKLNLDPYLTQFQEFTLEKNMKKMVGEWNPIELPLMPYRETGIYVFATVDKAQLLLDDQIVKTQSMRGSPYIKPFENEIRDWERKLLVTRRFWTAGSWSWPR